MRVDLANWGQIKGQTAGGPSGANIPMPQSVRPTAESGAVEVENIQKKAAIEQQTSQKWEAIFQGLGKTITGWNKQANALGLKKLEGHLQKGMLEFRMGAAKQFQGLTDEEMKPANIMKLLPERVDEFLTNFEKSDEVASILDNPDIRRFWDAGRPTAVNKIVEMALPVWQTDFTNRENAANSNWEEQIGNAETIWRISTVFPASDPKGKKDLLALTGISEKQINNPKDLRTAANLILEDYKAYLKEAGKPQAVIDRMVIEAKKKSEHAYLALLKTFPKGSLDDVMPDSLPGWHDAFPHADKVEISAVYNKLVEVKRKSEQAEILTELELDYLDNPDPLKTMQRLEKLPNSLEGLKEYVKKGGHLSTAVEAMLKLNPTNLNKYRIKLLKALRVLEKDKAKLNKEDKAALIQEMRTRLVNASSDNEEVAADAVKSENLIWNDERFSKSWQKLTKTDQNKYITTITAASTYGAILDPLIARIEIDNIRSIIDVKNDLQKLGLSTAGVNVIKNLETLIKSKRHKTRLDEVFLGFIEEGTISRANQDTLNTLHANAQNRFQTWLTAYHQSPAETIRASLTGLHQLKHVAVGQRIYEGNIVANGIKLEKIQNIIESSTTEGEYLPKDLKAQFKDKIDIFLGLAKHKDSSISADNIGKFYKYLSDLELAFLGGGGEELSPEDRVVGENIWNKFVQDNVPAKAYAAWQIQESKKLVALGQLDPTSRPTNVDNTIALTLRLTKAERDKTLSAKLLSGGIKISILGETIDTANKLESYIDKMTSAGVNHTGGWFFDFLADTLRRDYAALLVPGTDSDRIHNDYDKMLFNEFSKLDQSKKGWEFFADAPSAIHRWAIRQHETYTPAFGGADPLSAGYMKEGLNDLIMGHLTFQDFETVEDIVKITQEYMAQLTQRELVIPVSEKNAIRFPKEFVPENFRGRYSGNQLSFAIDQIITEKIMDNSFVMRRSLDGAVDINANTISELLKDGEYGKDFFIAPVQIKDGKFIFKFFVTSENEKGFPNSFIMVDPSSPENKPQPIELKFQDVFERAALRDTLALVRGYEAILPKSSIWVPDGGYSDLDGRIGEQGGAIAALKNGMLFPHGISTKPWGGASSEKVLEALLQMDDKYYKRKGEEAGTWAEKRSFHFAKRAGADMWERVMKGAPKHFDGYNKLQKYISNKLKSMNKEYTPKFINTRKAGLLPQLEEAFGFGPLSGNYGRFSNTVMTTKLSKDDSKPSEQEVIQTEIERNETVVAGQVQQSIAEEVISYLDLQSFSSELGFAIRQGWAKLDAGTGSEIPWSPGQTVGPVDVEGNYIDSSKIVEEETEPSFVENLGSTVQSIIGNVKDAVDLTADDELIPTTGGTVGKLGIDGVSYGHQSEDTTEVSLETEPSSDAIDADLPAFTGETLKEVAERKRIEEGGKPQVDLETSTAAMGIATTDSDRRIASKDTFKTLVKMINNRPTKGIPTKKLTITNPNRGDKVPIEDQLKVIAKKLGFSHLSEMIQYQIRTAKDGDEKALWQELFADLSQFIGDLKKLPIVFYRKHPDPSYSDANPNL